MTDSYLIPKLLTDGQWRGLAKEAGLQEEEWGEGWIAIEREFRAAGAITREVALVLLRSIAERAQAAVELRELLAAA